MYDMEFSVYSQYVELLNNCFLGLLIHVIYSFNFTLKNKFILRILVTYIMADSKRNQCIFMMFSRQLEANRQRFKSSHPGGHSLSRVNASLLSGCNLGTYCIYLSLYCKAGRRL